MLFRKNNVLIMLVLILVSGLAKIAHAGKSVYVISSTNADKVQAYKIDGSQVDFQADVDISNYNQGLGAVGLATWPEKNLLFVTYEGSGVIVWSSSKTLEKIGDYKTGVPNLARIAYDKSLSNRTKAVLGFTPQAFDQAINSVISTRLLEVSQL